MIFEHVHAQQPSEVPCALAFVGEAPGDSEVCYGRPLCGPSGKIFNQMLRMAGIAREACWVGNVFDERLPSNDIKNWCQKEPHAKGALRFPGAGYLSGEHYWHFDRLGRELDAAQPAVIVPLGGTALWAFTGVTSIGDARGAIQRASLIVPGAKLLPTYHPAYVLRQYKMLGTVVADFKKAKTEASRAPETVKQSPRELWLDPTLADIAAFIREYLIDADLITIDIETSVNQITKIGFGADQEHAISIPFVDYRKPDRCYWQSDEDEVDAWNYVRTICEMPQPKLLQNGPFDVWHLIRAGVLVNNWREDTRLLHHALYPELPKSLAYMGSTYAHEGPWKLLRHGGKAKRDE